MLWQLKKEKKSFSRVLEYYQEQGSNTDKIINVSPNGKVRNYNRENTHKKENNIRTESIITLSECKRTKWCESCKVDFPNENPKIGSDLVVVQKESMCV